MRIAGIDYGARMSGTTVIGLTDESLKVDFFHCPLKIDADLFIKEILVSKNVEKAFIDAPLSLPGVYTDPDSFENYFFREADLQTKAMSPMFIGGLSARAIKLSKELEQKRIETFEVYPAIWAQRFNLKNLQYKKKKLNIPVVARELDQQLPFEFIISKVDSWHHVDSLLALYSGYRYLNNKHESFGKAAEGLIII